LTTAHKKGSTRPKPRGVHFIHAPPIKNSNPLISRHTWYQTHHTLEITGTDRYLEIRPVILSESEGSLRPARQILRCAQDDRQNASSPLNGKPSLQMSAALTAPLTALANCFLAWLRAFP